MIFKTLKHVELDKIVECLNISFADYPVKMPESVDFWKIRWQKARVDFDLSFGAFVDNRLVGILIHAVDVIDGKKMAYNTGTGVIPEYRGLHVVDKMYKYGKSKLKKQKVTVLSLEVLCENERAINVYERLGFKKDIKLHSYDIVFDRIEDETFLVQDNLLKSLPSIAKYQSKYAWDFKSSYIQVLPEDYIYYTIMKSHEQIGYAIITPTNTRLIQIESYYDNYAECFSALASRFHGLTFINVKETRLELISAIENTSSILTLSQFNMNKSNK